MSGLFSAVKCGSDDGLSRPRHAGEAGGRDHAYNRGTARADKFHKPENDVSTGGQGHSDQGRFQSFPIHDDEHLLLVCQHAERHARRVGLVDRAVEDSHRVRTPCRFPMRPGHIFTFVLRRRGPTARWRTAQR